LEILHSGVHLLKKFILLWPNSDPFGNEKPKSKKASAFFGKKSAAAVSISKWTVLFLFFVGATGLATTFSTPF
jgi:hypothetical protein